MMRFSNTLKHWWPLALLVVLSMGIRLFHLGTQGLFMDEAVSWAVSRLTPKEIMGASEFNHHVPLYFVLLKGAMTVLPTTETGVRAFSVLASAVALIAVLVFLKAEWGLAAAVYAGILMALSSFDLYYAQETRMYTLLAAAWIIGYIALVKALQGRAGFLAVWAIAMIVMPWTHLYGFLLVGTNLAFVAGYLVLKRFFRFTASLDDRWLLIASLAVVVGILPMVRLLLLNSDANSQGASTSGLQSILDLYLLWTAGLVAARNNFADSAHLTLPATENLSPLFWFIAGTVIAGAPAGYGLAKAWRMGESRRLQAILAIVNLLLPVALVFGYSTITGNRIWIQRPFLGAAYLIYLWAGVGVAAMRWRRARWALVPLAALVALASLLPYFSTWQKSDAAQALRSMPALDQANALLLEMRFLSSQARFYLGPDTSFLAIHPDKDGMPVVVRPSFDNPAAGSYAKIMGRPRDVACDELATVTDLWLYGNREGFRRTMPQLPGCVTEKRLWTFGDGRWSELEPVARDVIDGAGWLQFDDVRKSDWTTQAYRAINPGDALRISLQRANQANYRLTLRYFDAPGKVLEVWVADHYVGRVGDGNQGGGWVQETFDLPTTSLDSMPIELRSVGTTGSAVASLGVTRAQ